MRPTWPSTAEPTEKNGTANTIPSEVAIAIAIAANTTGPQLQRLSRQAIRTGSATGCENNMFLSTVLRRPQVAIAADVKTPEVITAAAAAEGAMEVKTTGYVRPYSDQVTTIEVNTL